jgi:hypothetical protein
MIEAVLIDTEPPKRSGRRIIPPPGINPDTSWVWRGVNTLKSAPTLPAKGLPGAEQRDDLVGAAVRAYRHSRTVHG